MENEQKADATEPKKSSKKVLFLGLAIVLMLGVGAGAWWAFRDTAKAQTEEEHEATPQIKAVLHLEKFVVNLADAEANRFLRVEINLGMRTEPASSGHGGGEDDPSSTARIRDTILEVLATWESHELVTPEGKAELKEQLIQALRKRAPELGVEEVYFTDFLVQR